MNSIKLFFSTFKKRIIGSIFAVIIVVGSVLGFAFKQETLLLASGSTTVLPMLESLSESYYKDTNNKVSVGPGGSTVGINMIQNSANLIDFGDSSRYPKLSNSEYNSPNWKNLSTMTLAYDVIVFGINMQGTGCHQIDNTKPIIITPKDVDNLYLGKVSSVHNMFESHTKSDNNVECNTPSTSITTIAMREAGSGTRDSFFNALDSYFKSEGDHQKLYLDYINSNKQVNPITLSSNGLMAQTLKNMKSSFGFLSLESLDTFKGDPNVKLAAVDTSNTKISTVNQTGNIYNPNDPAFKDAIYTKSINADQKSEDLYRFWHPMNLIWNVTNKKKPYIKNFLYWILLKQNTTLIDTAGYIPFLGYTKAKDHTNKFEVRVPLYPDVFWKFFSTPDHNKYGLIKDNDSIKNKFPNTPWWVWIIPVSYWDTKPAPEGN